MFRQLIENDTQAVELFTVPGYTLARVYNKLTTGMLWVNDLYLSRDLDAAKRSLQIYLGAV